MWRESSNKGLLNYLIQILKFSLRLLLHSRCAHTCVYVLPLSAYLFFPDFLRKVLGMFEQVPGNLHSVKVPSFLLYANRYRRLNGISYEYC